MDPSSTIYLRKLRVAEARRTLLKELDAYFMKGINNVDIVHGVGTYTIRNMVREEITKIDYAVIVEDDYQQNYGITRVKLLCPSEDILKSYQ